MPTTTVTMFSSQEYSRLGPHQAIETLQAQISDAKSLLIALEGELNRQHARLCPIRRLNTDVVMLIFEFTSRYDWKSSLAIAAVSHQWRTIVHSTPKAWCSLHIPDRPPMKIISRYLKYSQPLLLHMSTPDAYPPYSARDKSLIDAVNKSAGRIKCMSIGADELDMLTGQFPNLRRLLIATHSAPIRLNGISKQRFPSVQQLFVYRLESLERNWVTPPPIQHLDLSTDYNRAWIKALVLMEKNLVSLRLNFSDGFYGTESAYPLDLPRLQYLSINVDRGGDCRFKARAPSLRTYSPPYVNSLTEARGVEVDFALITHLDLDAFNVCDLALYPALRHIRSLNRPDKLIEGVRQGDYLCPLLETVEFFGGSEEGGCEWLERCIYGTTKYIGVIERGYLQPWRISLPGDYAIRCGDDSSCVRRRRIHDSSSERALPR